MITKQRNEIMSTPFMYRIVIEMLFGAASTRRIEVVKISITVPLNTEAAWEALERALKARFDHTSQFQVLHHSELLPNTCRPEEIEVHLL